MFHFDSYGTPYVVNSDGLVQDCSNSIANAMVEWVKIILTQYRWFSARL